MIISSGKYMCGILGFTGKKDSTQTESLLKMIGHRGYDDSTVNFSNGLNFAMNRLAIVDLTKGYYPFHYKNFLLVYNGEIYNYKTLQSKLLKQGVKFRTHCDAEVILPLFDKYGTKAFDLLEGMYAVCIIDTTSNILTLARDKAGEKPLYYCLNKGFSFSSEMKVLLSSTSDRVLNKEVLTNYLRDGSVFGKETLVKDIFKLTPGSYLQYHLKNKTLKVKPFWQPIADPNSVAEKFPNPVEHLESLLKKSVESRLLSDVPLGCFLSGGVDSSLVTSLATQKINNLKTFSISFPGYAEDESKYSKIAADFLGTQHTMVECTPKSVRKIMDNIGEIVDDPISDPAVLPTFLMSREARKHVKVVLTGEGADELFGGYYRYQKYFLHAQINKTIRTLGLKKVVNQIPSHRLRSFNESVDTKYSAQNTWTENELKELIVESPALRKWPRNNQLLDKDTLLFLQMTDFTEYLPAQLLLKVDKITMQNNLEARAPFLDSELIEFALQLKFKHKIQGIHNKYILRQVASRHLPKEIVWRVKHGFSVPLNNWFRKELKDFAQLTEENVSKLDTLFDPDYFSEKMNEHMEHKSENRDKIWSLFVLTEWMKKYKIQVS